MSLRTSDPALRPGPALRRLIIGDEPTAWAAAGFAVDDASTLIGAVTVSLVGGDHRGVLGWELATPWALTPAEGIDGIHGIETTVAGDSSTGAPAAAVRRHPNRVDRLDHVVLASPDLQRTLADLGRWGFEVRRQREVPDSDPPRRQVFLWAGEPVIELVGPTEPGGDGPARVWGLALATDDLDGAASLLGSAISTPRPAVQPGRRIATIRTRDIDISIPLALMSPHPGS